MTVVYEKNPDQMNIFLRLIYFLVVGWWLGALWLIVAWILSVLILTLPIAVLMYNRTGAVMTLHRN
jgi:hypothetical protein